MSRELLYLVSERAENETRWNHVELRDTMAEAENLVADCKADDAAVRKHYPNATVFKYTITQVPYRPRKAFT